jgi:hypothetical protein
MKRHLKRHSGSAALAFLLCIGAAQLIRPDITNPKVIPARSLWNDHRVDPRVAGVLRRACANCHSYETQWPWYSQISPVSWIMARHVRNGRAKLNFSEWTGASASQLEEICDPVDKNQMPPSDYALMHPEARLSKADREILDAWADGKLAQLRP